MNRITTISTSPVRPLPMTALSPPVKAYSSSVIAVAPTIGPAQWRVPPSTDISTTVRGIAIVKVSPVVT